MVKVIEEFLREFNELYPKLRMDLVLFDDAILFLCKVNRIIQSPCGNALLVGLGGTGCRSLSRLAAFMQDFSLSELEESSEWYDFLRETLK
jgi:dynein heavy chain